MLTTTYFKMYTAIDTTTNIKSTADEAVKENNYKCEKCKSTVFLRKGLVRVAHFSHPAGSMCDNMGETQLHLTIKKDMFNSIATNLKGRVKNLELEKYLGTVRPDIYIEGKRHNIAIEIQASALTPAQILFRTEKYYQLGVYVLWVLPFEQDRFFKANKYGTRDWLSVKLREYERILMYMYYKTVVFWDISHIESEGFIAVEFGDEWTSATEFYDVDYGEERYFEPRKLKTIKIPQRIKLNLVLSDFKLSFAKEFPMPMADYTLPKRYIVSYDWRNSAS